MGVRRVARDFHPELVYLPREDEPDTHPFVGRDRWEQSVGGFMEAFAEITFGIEDSYDAGDWSIVSTLMHASGGASGVEVEDRYVFAYRIRRTDYRGLGAPHHGRGTDGRTRAHRPQGRINVAFHPTVTIETALWTIRRRQGPVGGSLGRFRIAPPERRSPNPRKAGRSPERFGCPPKRECRLG